MCQISTATNWIPIIGTLAGAVVGFAASFGTAYFNQRKTANEAKDQRQRERLETLYEVLINIKRDYQSMTSDVINKVHFGTPIDPKVNDAIPPLIHLEMLINLYVPEIDSLYNNLIEAKEAVGKKYADALTNDFSKESKEEKQKICGIYMQLTETTLKAVEKMQHKVSTVIKA